MDMPGTGGSCLIQATWEADSQRIEVQDQPAQIVRETSSPKYPEQKQTGHVAQAVEHMLYKCKSSNPSSTSPSKKMDSIII
jgi:hypothetical protein